MDISDTLAPNSDQLDAIDLVSGPRTFTISSVSRGNAEQPVQFTLAEFPRVWRPGKSMRRVLAACWGTDASQYIGRRVTLYMDPDVMFGKERTGGTRIKALSHIDKRTSVPLLVSRGKSAMFTVEPLKEAPPVPREAPAEDIAAMTDVKALRGMWQAADPNTRLIIEARVAELGALPDADPTQPGASR